VPVFSSTIDPSAAHLDARAFFEMETVETVGATMSWTFTQLKLSVSESRLMVKLAEQVIALGWDLS
jgi:hypothetical protein